MDAGLFVFQVYENCLNLGENCESIAHLADFEYCDIRYAEEILIYLSFLTEYYYCDITLNFRSLFLSMPKPQ